MVFRIHSNIQLVSHRVKNNAGVVVFKSVEIA
jgi:hypothetical protein